MSRLVSHVRFLFLIGMLLLAGCNGQSPAPMVQGNEQSNAPPAAAVKPTGEIKEGEAWEICFLQGQRVGYGHSTVRRAREDGRDVLHLEKTDHLAIQRAGQTSRQEVRALSIETLDGKLLRFENEMRMGAAPIRISGQVRGDRVEAKILGPGAKTPKKASIPWANDYQGPFATEQSLLRQPMQPGERRGFKMLMCGFGDVDVIDVLLVAKKFETVELPNGKKELLRIDASLSLPGGNKMDGVIWTTSVGETLKQSAAGLDIYRTSKAQALDEKQEKKPAEVDVMARTSVKLVRPLDDPHGAPQLRFRVHLDGADPSQLFPVGPTQSVQAIDKNTAEVTVYGIRPGDKRGNREAPADPPSDAERTPNNFIQSDDSLVVAFADRAAGEEKDPWRMAVALEQFVHKVVKHKDFTQGFASAAEVARSLEGDCTEHAVLLAAMARAKGIPARVAIGLVYLAPRKLDGSSDPTFFYHMWTEVFVDGRWVPIDGTLARGGIGAGHLKIGHSSLQGASVYSAFLPVLNVIGKLRIEPIDEP